MKKLLTTLFFSFLLSLAFCQSSDNAVAYLNSIDAEYNLIVKDTWDYTRTAAHSKSARKVETRRKELLRTIEGAKAKIRVMSGFKGDVSYRDSVVAFLEMYKIMLNEDYAKIVDMEEISEQSYDDMEAYLLAKEKANEKMDAASEMIRKAELDFAKRNNVNIVEGEADKISKKLKIANEVYDYYNVLYLIFFKSYKQEAYLLDAMSKSDVNGVEQNRTTLLNYATEGLEKVSKITAFKSDIRLKTSCKKMLDFYKEEVSVKIPQLQKFYMAKEKFEKTKVAFDAIKEKDRTQADVDKINSAGAEYNNEVANYNKINQELNNLRNDCLQNWNKSAESFLDDLVP